MLKAKKLERLIFRYIAVVIILALFSASAAAAAGQEDPFGATREKLDSITSEEKDILQNLFALAQEIELMEIEEKELALETESIEREIKGLEAAITEDELAYEKKQESLKRVLKSYQRMGQGSFLEIILDSDSLSTLLQRLNTLRDLTRNTGELLDQLEASKGKLASERERLSQRLILIKEKIKQSKEALEKKMKLKGEKEAYLVSLKGEKEHYEEYLKDIEKMWSDMKPLFSKAATEFSRIIKEGSLPSDALKLTFSLFSAKGAIEDKVINKVISEQSSLPKMQFEFHQGKVDIKLPEYSLVLSGTFIIQEGHTLKFQPQQGSFSGMPLKPGSIEELFSEGELVLDLEPLLAGNAVHEVELKEGYIELISRYSLF